MNREKQIENANPYSGDNAISISKKFGFTLGAEWADEHPVSPWISVEDNRLPEDEEPVLTSSGIYGTKLLVWNDRHKVWDDEEGDDYFCERDKIDAWMKIPE